MHQQDYILRIIEQLVQAIASIMQRRKAGDYKGATQQIHTAMRNLLKIDLNLLLLYDDQYILSHFKDFTGQFETEKCVLGADLLYELALIEEVEKKQTTATQLKELCLQLYAIGLPNEVKYQENHYEKVSTLISELDDHKLSENALASLKICNDLIKNEEKGKP